MKAIKARRFAAGIHIKDMKYLAKDAPIETFPLPNKVAISLSQSLGKPATPCVAKGDKVKEGQTIGIADGMISVNVSASVSGTVEDVTTLTVNGKKETYVVIQTEDDEERAYLPPLADPTPEQIIERVQQAGVVGLGGAGFPTAVKLKPRSPVDTLIVNGAECEPYLTCDDVMMQNYAEQVYQGAKLLAKALGASKIYIGIEANKPKAIAAFAQYDDIQVVSLKRVYPMGGEKQLIYAVTGKKVRLGQLPASVGIVVNNVATCFAVNQAVTFGKPLYETLITVSGQAIATPKNLWVRVGTPIEEIIAYCGGAQDGLKKVIIGGPMTGFAVKSFDFYVHKTTSAVLLLNKKEAVCEEPTPCISCGKCADACPMRLMPMNTEFYAAAGDYERAAKMGGALNCIECGACAYICPARRPLLQAIKTTKEALRNANKEEK